MASDVHAPSCMPTAAPSISVRVLRQQMFCHVVTATTMQVHSPRRLASNTPSRGPSESIRNGTLTSANPRPVTRCMAAPKKVPSAASPRLSSGVTLAPLIAAHPGMGQRASTSGIAGRPASTMSPVLSPTGGQCTECCCPPAGESQAWDIDESSSRCDGREPSSSSSKTPWFIRRRTDNASRCHPRTAAPHTAPSGVAASTASCLSSAMFRTSTCRSAHNVPRT